MLHKLFWKESIVAHGATLDPANPLGDTRDDPEHAAAMEDNQKRILADAIITARVRAARPSSSSARVTGRSPIR